MVADRRLSLDVELPARWGRAQRWKNTLIYWAVRAAFWCVQHTPFGLALAVGVALGRMGWTVAAKERRRTLEHLAIAFPELTDAERRRLGRDCFVHLGRCAAEATHVERFLEGPRAIRIGPEGRAVLDAALADKKGVVAVSGHIGNWELMAQVVAKHGYDVSGIAKPLYDPRLTRWVDAERARSGLTVIWRRDESSAKEMLRVFRRGGILAMLIDQDTRVQSVFAPFFGRPAHTPSAAAALALRTAAPVVVCWMHRVGAEHVVSFERLELGGLPEERDAAVLALTARMNARLEAAIRLRPEQWVWMHRRWKTRPAE
jgi:Kdo2-lipid IVA lauroyltransferase/acyltransferase